MTENILAWYLLIGTFFASTMAFILRDNAERRNEADIYVATLLALIWPIVAIIVYSVRIYWRLTKTWPTTEKP